MYGAAYYSVTTEMKCREELLDNTVAIRSKLSNICKFLLEFVDLDWLLVPESTCAGKSSAEFMNSSNI